ncbi:MAG: MotA/TolQ/ExbB proton channel family protein [Akkermansiaceae bacterium]
MINKLKHRPRVSAFTILLFVLLSAPQIFAQDAAAPAALKKSFLARWVLDGGPTMLFIGAAVVAYISLGVYKAMNMTKSKFTPSDLHMALMDHMVNCRVRSAIELAATHPSYLGRLVAYAFPNIDATQPENLGRDQVEDAIADFTNNEARKALQWVNYISLCAQASPMLGLLGTVMGMVSAFATLQTSGGADPSALAGDISVALLTTLWGLINAIPAIVSFVYYKNKYNQLVSESVHAAEEMLNAAIATVNADTLYAKIPEGIAV